MIFDALHTVAGQYIAFLPCKGSRVVLQLYVCTRAIFVRLKYAI